MTEVITKSAIALAVLLYGQANYIAGFDSGTDTSICVLNEMIFHEKHEACGRIWVNSPALISTRVWRNISGDEVKP